MIRTMHLGGLFWGPFLTACVGTMVIDASAGYVPAVGRFAAIYQRLIAPAWNSVPRYTAVLELDPDAGDCAQRQAVAELLDRVGAAGSRAIVIEKVFPRQPCGLVDSKLRQAVLSASRSVPVVVGRKIADDVADSGNDEDGDDDQAPQILASFAFDAATAQVSEGLVNLAPDPRRLPLQWLASLEGSAGTELRKTLAVEAAEAYDRELQAHHPRLASLMEDQEQPYVSLLGTPEVPAGVSTLSGKVVLLGEKPEVYLHANYVEALLDDRYYRPMPLLDYLVAFACLLAVEWILTLQRGKWLRIAVLMTVVAGALPILLRILIGRLGWYVSPLTVIGIALLVRTFYFHASSSRRTSTS